MSEETKERAILEAEERVCERVGEDGCPWRKVYFGGGDHLEGWLAQCIEIAGEENVEVEEVRPEGLACFDPDGGGLFRIWVRRGWSATSPSGGGPSS